MTKIPDFETLDEAVEFWESHDSADYWDDMEEVTFEVDLQHNLLYPKLVVLTYKPEDCPRCHHTLEHIVIEYVSRSKERLVIIRDVPALQCQINRHEYILEETLDTIERLLELETTQKLQPTEMIQVPVFNLKMAV